MKKIFILVLTASSFVACKKETTSTPTQAANTNNSDTTKYITNGIASIGKPIGKIGSGVTDIDGNTYKTVILGSQEWMAENLKVTQFNDETNIPNITDGNSWEYTKLAAWCYYDNDSTKNKKFGKLYNGYVVITNGNKNVCPINWHIPTNSEWNVLTDYLGGVGISGGKMKSIDNQFYKNINIDATNTSLFSSLPGGIRGGSFFYWGGNNAYYFSSTEKDWGIIKRDIFDNTGDIGGKDEAGCGINAGMSIRCIKD